MAYTILVALIFVFAVINMGLAGSLINYYGAEFPPAALGSRIRLIMFGATWDTIFSRKRYDFDLTRRNIKEEREGELTRDCSPVLIFIACLLPNKGMFARLFNGHTGFFYLVIGFVRRNQSLEN